jgi:hypothetical protein
MMMSSRFVSVASKLQSPIKTCNLPDARLSLLTQQKQVADSSRVVDVRCGNGAGFLHGSHVGSDVGE